MVGPTFSGLNHIENPNRVAATYLTHSKPNSYPPGQNGRRFTDDIFICNFMNEKFCILIQISLEFVLNGPIDNMSVLVQVMAWHLFGTKPLPEPTLAQLTDAYMRH